MNEKNKVKKIIIEREYIPKSEPGKHIDNQASYNNKTDYDNNNYKQSDYDQEDKDYQNDENERFDAEVNLDEDIDETGLSKDGELNEGEGSEGESNDGNENEEFNDEKSKDDESNDENEGKSKNEENGNKYRRNLNPYRNETNKDKENKSNKGSSSESPNDLKGNKKIPNMDEAQHNIEDVKNKFKGVGKIGSAIGKILINPIFWIIMLLIVALTYFISTITIIGQNDYNIMCDGSGVGSIIIDPNADDFTRQSAIASWFTSTPFEFNGGQTLSKEQASGIMGNLMEESYGANPKAIQGDSSLRQWETTDNNTVLGWGNVGGKAVGIIQWDRGRRINLVNFAISEGTQWHDLTTQLKFLKSEMDTGYEREQLNNGGFNEIGKSVADYAKIWNVYFERSGAAGTPAGDNPRIASAEAFASAYTGGSYGGGLSTSCVGGLYSGGGIDASNLVQLAIQSAWPSRSPALGRCVGLTNCGQYFATDGYKQAKLAAEFATSKDPIAGLLASCDRFVATMYRATGQDSSFPWGDTGIQGNYMRNSPNWEQISCQERQPGDVLWREGHIMLYLGNVNGRDSIGSASYMERSGSLSGVSCSGDNFVGDGDTAIGFRKVR